MKDYQGYANNIKVVKRPFKDPSLKEIWDCAFSSATHSALSLSLFTGQNAHADSGRMLSKVRLWWWRRYGLSEIELRKFHRSLVRRDFAEKCRVQNFPSCITALYLPSVLSPNWLVGYYAIVKKMMMIEKRPKLLMRSWSWKNKLCCQIRVLGHPATAEKNLKESRWVPNLPVVSSSRPYWTP